MFAKKYGILVAVEAIFVKLCFNLFVVVKVWPIFHVALLAMYVKKNQKLLFLQFSGGYLAY
jgi:hypothetical protein